MNADVKDALQALAWIATAGAACVAAAKFWSELRLGREQRARELRWKQAEAGKSLNDEMLVDPEAWPALQMLDYSGKVFTLPSTKPVAITHDDLERALDPNLESPDEKANYIRQCFDSLFYYMSLLHHYTKSTLMLGEDVAFPLNYYVPLLAKLRPTVDRYLEKFPIGETLAFLETTRGWRPAAPQSGAKVPSESSPQ